LDSRHTELIEEIQQRELALCRAMTSMGPEPWLDLDMSMAQFKTIFVLATAPAEDEGDGPRMSDVARRLGVSAPTASTLIDRLVERGLVDRREDPRDRRQHRCRLSPEGHWLAARFYESARARTKLLLAQLSQDELETVLHGLEYLVRAAERLTARTEPVEAAGAGAR
jgi:DNA-binding MarR family transcriptional regulator